MDNKIIFDKVMALFGLIFLSPILLIVAILIKVKMPGGPVIFKQKRVGLHKKHFNILKFRSMPTEVPKDMPTHQFKAEDMLSKWQKFIRKHCKKLCLNRRNGWIY